MKHIWQFITAVSILMIHKLNLVIQITGCWDLLCFVAAHEVIAFLTARCWNSDRFAFSVCGPAHMDGTALLRTDLHRLRPRRPAVRGAPGRAALPRPLRRRRAVRRDLRPRRPRPGPERPRREGLLPVRMRVRGLRECVCGAGWCACAGGGGRKWV